MFCSRWTLLEGTVKEYSFELQTKMSRASSTYIIIATFQVKEHEFLRLVEHPSN
jgi:hypothetical protein